MEIIIISFFALDNSSAMSPHEATRTYKYTPTPKKLIMHQPNKWLS